MAQARAQTDTLIGEVLASRYRIEHRLGEGAMGVVYKARHVKVGRPFAVKVLHPNLLTDNKIEQRFEREAELAGRLRHPNVIGVVDVGETAEGFRYMVMDYVEGKDLAALLVEAPMPPHRIIRLVRQMLEGLYHAHQQGLIHRDFKPENVIVEKDTHGDEVPRIVDFGIAILREGGDSPESPGRLTTNGLVLGTPHYMAPEQAVADPVDHRIDLFAMGIVIYEMLSGKLPFDGTGAEVARANLMLDPPPISKRVPYLEVDPLLEAFARKLLAKSRDMRPPTAKAARELLDLIERDRTAAAAALGVPAEVGTRLPAVTAPVVARPAVSESLPPVSAPSASAPAMPAVIAVAEPSPVPPAAAERDIWTDELPRRRNGLAIVAAAMAIAVVAVIAFVIAGGSHDDGKLATNEPASLAGKPSAETSNAADTSKASPDKSNPADMSKPTTGTSNPADTTKAIADTSKSTTDKSNPADTSKSTTGTSASDTSKSTTGTSASDMSKPTTGASNPADTSTSDTAKSTTDKSTTGTSNPADTTKAIADTSRSTTGASKSATGVSKSALGSSKLDASKRSAIVDKSKHVDAKHPTTKPVDTNHTTNPVDTHPTTNADIKSDAKPSDVKPEVKPADTKPADIKPADTKPADTKPALTPASVHILFAQVGGELLALKAAKGVAAYDDLWTQYRSITIDRDAAPPHTESTAALLYKLRAAAKERMH